MLKKIQNIDCEAKTIVYRVDYNVPYDRPGVIHPWQAWRIEATLPTLKYLIKRNCKIIILAHLGRPQGKKDVNLSLKPVAEKLAGFLKREVQTVTPNKPPEILQNLEKIIHPCYLLSKKGDRGPLESIHALKGGDILVLENLRFYSEERENSEKFAQSLARLGEIYISDAFAASHRKHASIYTLPQKLPAYAGLLLQKEVKTLTRIRDHPQSPLYLILGGAKVKTKATLIKLFLPKIKGALLGGVVANTILAAKGIKTGKSQITPYKIEQNFQDLSLATPKIHLPQDVKTATSPHHTSKINIRSVGNIHPQEMILDIGPKTAAAYQKIIKNAAEIIWNGNLGLSEVKAFSKGTAKIGKAVSQSNAFSIVGGGDTVAFLRKINVASSISFCSTGGGAMLELLAGKKLPGIKILQEK